MIIELVLVIPRSTGLDSKLGVPGPSKTEASAAKSGPVGQAHGLSPSARKTK